MNPAEVTQLQALVIHQGEMLATYQERLVALQAQNTHLQQNQQASSPAFSPLLFPVVVP